MSTPAPILVLDDEPDIRRFVAMSRTAEGWPVVQAATADEAPRAGEIRNNVDGEHLVKQAARGSFASAVRQDYLRALNERGR